MSAPFCAICTARPERICDRCHLPHCQDCGLPVRDLDSGLVTGWECFKCQGVVGAMATRRRHQGLIGLVLMLLMLAGPGRAAGLSEHETAVHNFAHIGLGAVAGVMARVFFSPVEDKHPYWCALGYVVAGAGAQLAYKAVYAELRDPRLPAVTGAGAVGGALIGLARIDVHF